MNSSCIISFISTSFCWIAMEIGSLESWQSSHFESPADHLLNPIIRDDTINGVWCSVVMSEMNCSHSLSFISASFCWIAMKIGSLKSWQSSHFEALIVCSIRLFLMICYTDFYLFSTTESSFSSFPTCLTNCERVCVEKSNFPGRWDSHQVCRRQHSIWSLISDNCCMEDLLVIDANSLMFLV
jgi:hypothetical protein